MAQRRELLAVQVRNESQHTQIGLDEVLLEIAEHLVARDEVELSEILHLFGKASGAERLSFFEVPTTEELTQLYLFDAEEGDVPYGEGIPELIDPAGWGRQEGEGPRVSKKDEGLHELMLPVMSEGNMHGYLSVEYPEERDIFLRKKGNGLVRLSKLLAGYFGRRMRQQQAQESEMHARRLMERHPMPIIIRSGVHILYANRAGVDLMGAERQSEVVGRTLYDFTSADSYDEELWERNVTDDRQGADLVEHEIIRLDGQERKVLSVSLPILFRGRQATQMVLQDVTQQRWSEERYRRFIETISEAIWCIELERPVSVNIELGEQVDQTWEHAYIAECNELMAGLLGVSKPEVVIGLSVDRLLDASFKQLIRAFVEAGYQLYNREYVVDREGPRPRHFLINAVGTVSHGKLTQIWGSSIEVTERIELERRVVKSLEDQQRRIGHDLHDSVGQLLTSVRMLSSNLKSQFAEEDDGYLQVSKIAQFADEASKQVSTIYRGLAPSYLHNKTLVEALDDLARGTTGTLPNVTSRFVHEGDVDVVDEETKLQLYRIAQEAVNNAIKHAEPSEIRIELHEEGGRLFLTIQDDGKGFKQGVDHGKSLGLHSMKYRARTIGGQLDITSTLGDGTTVAFSMLFGPQ